MSTRTRSGLDSPTADTQALRDNRNQNRIATCNEHDNWFKDTPDSSPEVEKIITKAGLTPEYRDLLEK